MTIRLLDDHKTDAKTKKALLKCLFHWIMCPYCKAWSKREKLFGVLWQRVAMFAERLNGEAWTKLGVLITSEADLVWK